MMPPEASSAAHKLYAESNQRLRPAARPPASSHSIHSMSYSGDYSAMGVYGFRKSSRGSVSAGVTGSAGASSPEGLQRDSHDLQLNLGNGRESLVDNLLLSFDKIGDSFGAFDTSPYFSAVDEMDDDDDDSASNYSQRTGPPPTARGRRSNSTSNYHSHIGSFSGGPGGSTNYGNRRVGSFDNGAESFGAANYDNVRETRSRGRGLGSSHGFANTYGPFDAAPPPSIRSGPRNRTPSPPRSPRLVRRPSNKSNRSLRRDQQQFNPHFEDPISLPPLPAFVNPATVNMPNKTPQKQGFFRRVLGIGGGGGSGSGSGSSSNSVISKQQSNPAPRETSLPPHTSDSPHSTINKKPSFFRRRKKSVSDAISQPIVPPPLHTTEPISPIEYPTQSPSTSLSAAMNPYLRSPVKSSPFDFADDDHEHAYLQRGATIRTVASSDPISPKRPTFFGESLRNRDSGSHYNEDYGGACKVYRKDTRYARGLANGDLGLRASPPGDREDWDRPQTSPYTSTFTHKSQFSKDEDEREMHWPPMPRQRSILSTRRSVDNVALERERQERERVERERQNSTTSSMYDKPRQGSVISREMPIATVQELDAQHARAERMRRESLRGKPLEVDTKLGANLGARGPENSWLSTPTPVTVGTPTVMLQRDGPGEKAKLLDEDNSDDDTDLDNDEPSEETRELARKVFEGDEEVIPKTGVTSWLGDGSIVGSRVRRAYMELFDFQGVNILSTLRIFCGRVVFKGETQQVDRIITSISKRWCECNPTHGFKSAEIVNTILFSLLMLNTDLHTAEIVQSQKMTRGQYIKNTMLGVRNLVAQQDAAPKILHYNTMPPRSQTPYRQSFQPNPDDPLFPATAPSATFPLARERKMSDGRGSIDFGRGNRNSSKTSGIGNLSPKGDDTTEKMDYDMDGGLALVKNSLGGGIKVWETQVEIVLKDFYQSVKACALPLHGAPEKVVEVAHSSTLSVFGTGMLRRSPSTVSRAPSELSVSNRNRDSKLGTKWTAKNRSRPRLYNGSYAASSRTSLEDRSMWSPSASSTWSKYSLDKTQTSMSVDSLGSAFTHADYQQSIGFANALSHAIIREEAASGTSQDDRASTLLDFDDLELSGAPWAKEGMLKHKHHLEGADKKAKNRTWTECFAVIEKGWMKLFQFGGKQSLKNSHAVGVVGGGNWTENADAIGSFLLRQTIASALPPPGYSKNRPNVWALSLPSGAVHFFEVGTAEIVREFVTTANYWAARLSKEPLIGGVSNVEYGWSDNVLGDYKDSSPPTTKNGEPRPSLQISIRSSIDHGSVVRARLPGDKINITDWAPPTQSMVASSLGEADQLRALENYVANIEAELARHNEMRPPMLIAFSPRHPNSSKAMGNWEKKSSYLLHEIIKFRTYIECLSSATALREKIKSGESDIGKVVTEIHDAEIGVDIPVYSA